MSYCSFLGLFLACFSGRLTRTATGFYCWRIGAGLSYLIADPLFNLSTNPYGATGEPIGTGGAKAYRRREMTFIHPGVQSGRACASHPQNFIAGHERGEGCFGGGLMWHDGHLGFN
jgi:hypothetical protein